MARFLLAFLLLRLSLLTSSVYIVLLTFVIRLFLFFFFLLICLFVLLICLSIFLPVYSLLVYIYLPICLFVSQVIYLLIYLHIYMSSSSIYMSTLSHLSRYLDIYFPFLYLSLSLFIFLFLYLYLFFSLFPSPYLPFTLLLHNYQNPFNSPSCPQFIIITCFLSILFVSPSSLYSDYLIRFSHFLLSRLSSSQLLSERL